MNTWEELKLIEERASRHKHNCNLKRYLLMDLEYIEEHVKKLREDFQEKYDAVSVEGEK